MRRVLALLAASLVVAACSTSGGGAPATTRVSDAGATPRRTPDAGGQDDADDDQNPIGDDCPAPAATRADLDQPDGAPGWNPPRPPQPTACTVADLAKFGDNVDAPNAVGGAGLVAGLPPSCAQCLLSQWSDATWQLIVVGANGAFGSDGFVNWGACYAVAPYGSDACGLAVQYLNLCVDESCHSCPAQQIQSCTTGKAATSACDANFGEQLTKSCDQTHAQALDDACGTIVDAAAVLCGNGLPDGGSLGD